MYSDDIFNILITSSYRYVMPSSITAPIASSWLWGAANFLGIRMSKLALGFLAMTSAGITPPLGIPKTAISLLPIFSCFITSFKDSANTYAAYSLFLNLNWNLFNIDSNRGFQLCKNNSGFLQYYKTRGYNWDHK